MMYFYTSTWDYRVMIRSACESLARGICQTLGILFSESPSRRGWFLTQKSQIEPGKSTLQAALTVAHHSFMSQSCTTVRMWSGLHTIAHLTGFTYSDISYGYQEGAQKMKMPPQCFPRSQVIQINRYPARHSPRKCKTYGTMPGPGRKFVSYNSLE